MREGRSPLLLTERTEHLRFFAEQLATEVPHVITLQGGMGRKALAATLARAAEAADGKGRVVIATGKYIGEGFDDPRLDTLFLAMPISWRETVAQYAGRLHRLHDGKREVRIYDYADLDVALLARMFDRRCRGYEAIGYTILLPASAVPGWPAEVPLPVDPAWKRDYAASVRRLIHDGVDGPLANLFVHAARTPAPPSLCELRRGPGLSTGRNEGLAKSGAEAQGEDRARSASEAFLFRRLQTLPESRRESKQVSWWIAAMR